MTAWQQWALLGAFVIVAICLFVSMRNSAYHYKIAKANKKYWAEEVDHRRDAERESYNWRSKYNDLLREYEELEELDEAEDYVRKSLGYPPDEDEVESKETA